MNRRITCSALSLVAAVLLTMGVAAPASAEFGVLPGTYSAEMSNSDAGAHADQVTAFTVNSHADERFPSSSIPDDNIKTLAVRLPPGVVGNATSYPQCKASELATNGCPADSQVGVIIYTVDGPAFFQDLTKPIYNMVPQNNDVAEFAFVHTAFGLVQISHIVVTVRTGQDYGITATIPRTSGLLGLLKASTTFWGVPAAAIHDGQRGDSSRGGCLGQKVAQPTGNLCPSKAPVRAFLSNPTQCDTTTSTNLSIDSWQNPGQFLSYDSVPQTFEGCDKLTFNPSISLNPTSHEAGGPTGLDVNLHVPQPWVDNPSALATPHLRKAVVTLPEGMSVNPAQADGLGACTEAEIGIHNADEPTCPDSSKIGTVEVDTPLLEGPLQGSVYLAKQTENPFGSLLAIYLVVGGHGVLVKLPGKIETDPDTGRLTTTFDENPQLPFEDFNLHFFGGRHAALINPPTCGAKTTEAELTSWSSPVPVDLQSTFELTSGLNGSPCPATSHQRPFKPAFEAGTTTPIAGAYSPFVLHLSREDGSQEFGSLSATLPPGLIGKLAGVPYCPEAGLDPAVALSRAGVLDATSPICPAPSRLGRVTVGVGAGDPFNVTGTAYLAGPYKGAPLSFAILTPALAGPFDLGTVLIRTALRIDPETTQITALSDPIPYILQGIPLDLRSIDLEIDRPDFTLNPTSCREMSVTGSTASLEGTIAALSNRFQVGACAALPFRPKLAFALKGPVHRRAHPSLSATLTAKPGEANIARAQVKLPPAAFLDNAHIGTVCTRPQFTAHQCPADSVYGSAEAITPLLNNPLKGNVYLRANPAHKLPDLVADLGGQIEVTLAGKTDSVNGALRNTFEAVPDAPVTKFSLQLYGGKRGLIEMSSGFCAHPKATARLDGQNGKVHDTTPVVSSSCAKKSAAKHHHR